MRLFLASLIVGLIVGLGATANAAPESLYHCQVLRVSRGNPVLVGEMNVNAYSTQPKIVYFNRNRDAALCAGTDPRSRPTLVCGFSMEDGFVRFTRVDQNPNGTPIIMAVVRDAHGAESLRPISYAATSVGSRDLHSILPLGESGNQMQITCYQAGRRENTRR